MKKKYSIFMGIGLVAVIIILIYSIQMSNKGGDELDQIVAQYHPVGASIALIEDNKIKEVRNYGYMNKAENQKVNDATRFKIASISKVTAAYAIMQIVDKGILDLDQPVNTYLTRYKIKDKIYDGNKITLRMLLSHTSGIRGDKEGDYHEAKPDVATVLSSSNIYIATEPGSRFSYSEVIGLGICQLVVEEVTGEKFEDYMVEHVFAPMQMNATDYAEEDNEKGKLALPYAGFGKQVQVSPSVLNAGGGVTTTSSDLARFAIALMDYYQKGNHEMFTVQENTQSAGGEYGLGIIPRRLSDGRTLYEHNGTLTGYNAQLVIEPESERGIVVVSNSDLAYYMTYDLMSKWTELALGERVDDAIMHRIKTVFSAIAIFLGSVIGIIGVYYVRGCMQKKFKWHYSKKKVIMLMILFGIGMFSICFAGYTDIIFQRMFDMKDYYLFTFFPQSFNWIILEIGIIYLAIALRMNLRRTKKERGR